MRRRVALGLVLVALASCKSENVASDAPARVPAIPTVDTASPTRPLPPAEPPPSLSPDKPYDDSLPEPDKPTAHVPKPWSFDVQNYALDIGVDPARHLIEGEVTIDVDDAADGLAELALDAVDMTISRVADTADTPRDVSFSYDGKTLRIPLAEPRRIGARRRFTVSYSTRPVRGMYFNDGAPRQLYTQGECEDSRYWFPCHDAPDDRATHSLRVKTIAPQAIGAGSVSELGFTAFGGVGVRDRAFHTDVPHVSYLTTLAAGEYEVVEEAGVVPLQYVVEARDAPYARSSFAKTDAILRFFGEFTGLPYPYPKYAQTCVRNFMFGGMENISATTLTDAAVHPPDWEPARSSTSLVAHEAAHQWFGDWITCSDWSHVWLNEGFATYFDALFTEHDAGREQFLWTLRGLRNDALGAMDSERRAVVSSVYADPFELFDGHSYAGGAVRLHMLRELLGDEPFRGAIRHYVKKYGLSCVTTDDFQKAVEEFTGQDLAWFFDQWFRKPGYPMLKVRWKRDETKSAVIVTVEQTQKTDGGVPEVYRLQLEVAIGETVATRGGGTRMVGPRETRRRFELTQRSQSFEIAVHGSLDGVAIDPDTVLLARFDLDGGRELPEPYIERNPSIAQDAAEARAAILKDDKRSAADRDAAEQSLISDFGGEKFAPLRAALAGLVASRKDDATANVLVRAMHADADLRVRLAAMEALHGFEGNAKASDGIAAHLDDVNDLVRAAAVAGIAKLKRPGAFEMLLDAVERPGWQSVVRVAALRGLADLGDERAFATLVRFSAPGDDWSRGAAIESLGRMGRKRSNHRDAVLPYLDDPERSVRQKAAEALGAMADPETIPTLCEHFKSESWPACRNALRNAVKACRAVAVEEGRLVTVEAARAAPIRERHALLRDEAEAVEKSLATLSGDAKTQAETRLKSLRDQMAQMHRDLDVLGVPVKPKEKLAAPVAK